MPSPRLLVLLLCMGAALSGCGTPGSSSSSSAGPAATVNGRSISMADYQLQLKVEIARSEDSLGYNACTVRGLTSLCKQIKQNALDTLIHQELIREYAQSHNITVPERDVDAQWAIIYKNRFHNDPAVFKAFQHHSHLDATYFKDSIRDDLYQNRVMFAVTRNLPSRAPAVRLAVFPFVKRADAEQARAMLLAHNSMRTVALTAVHETNSLCKTTVCGDKGWIPLSLIPPDRKVLATSPAGTVQGPFGIQQEFDVYFIEGRSSAEPLTANQEYAVRLQEFTKWLQQQQQRAAVKRYVAI